MMLLKVYHHLKMSIAVEKSLHICDGVKVRLHSDMSSFSPRASRSSSLKVVVVLVVVLVVVTFCKNL